MARAHLFRPVTDEKGNLLYGAQVTMRTADASGVIAQAIYAGPLSSAETLVNPFVISGGYIDVWLDTPERVDFLIETGGRDPFALVLDIAPPAEEVLRTAYPFQVTNEPYDGAILVGDSNTEASWQDAPEPPGGAVPAHDHGGDGANSTSLGTDAAATGANATSVGDSSQASGEDATSFGYLSSATGDRSSAYGANSSATGDDSTTMGQGSSASDGGTSMGQGALSSGRAAAFGRASQASGEGAVAVGPVAQATGEDALAVGAGANASGERAMAVGPGTNATHARAAAVGPGAETTDDDQVALGGPGSTVAVLGALRVDQNATLAGATGLLSFFGAEGAPKQTVEGVVTDPVLAEVIALLAAMGLIEDATTEGIL